MSVNPYQSPEIVADVKDPRSARRWVAAPALGIWIAGALYFVLGISLFVSYSIAAVSTGLSRRIGPLSKGDVIGTLAACLIGLLLTTVGWLAMQCARRLYRLDSKHAAIAACLLGVIMYPLCMVTLPLGILGLIMLRRADVQEELVFNSGPSTPE